MTTIKDTFLKVWFALSVVTLGLLYLFFDKRGRAITQLKSDAQRQLLGQKLVAISEKTKQSEEDANEARDDYEALKRRHADLLQQFGIFTGGVPAPKPKLPPNTGPSGNA